MTNWRELLDEYARSINDARGKGADELAVCNAARRAIELALNKQGIMCWDCGVLCSWLYQGGSCEICGQPYDAPEGT